MAGAPDQPKAILSPQQLENLKKTITDFICMSMEHDHLDSSHKAASEPAHVVNHFRITAQGIIFGELEMFLDAENEKERAQITNFMLKSYAHAENVSNQYNLAKEFADEARLDKAVKTAHKYLLSTESGSKAEQDKICYITLNRKKIHGAVLLEYFIHDILKDAYEMTFQHLGVVPPNREPIITRKA